MKECCRVIKFAGEADRTSDEGWDLELLHHSIENTFGFYQIGLIMPSLPVSRMNMKKLKRVVVLSVIFFAPIR